tara:strand:+ start:544 stop:843 length:300 start_codon:yes stop_codon:yes gene_type:complete
MWAMLACAKPVFDIATKFSETFRFKKLPQKISEIIKEMTRDRIIQIYDAASNGIMRPEQAAILLSEVCETTLELFKIVEQQNLRLKICQETHDQSTKTT